VLLFCELKETRNIAGRVISTRRSSSRTRDSCRTAWSRAMVRMTNKSVSNFISCGTIVSMNQVAS
jgi:hypothetical protein